jgi:hypothetical protein
MGSAPNILLKFTLFFFHLIIGYGFIKVFYTVYNGVDLDLLTKNNLILYAGYFITVYYNPTLGEFKNIFVKIFSKKGYDVSGLTHGDYSRMFLDFQNQKLDLKNFFDYKIQEFENTISLLKSQQVALELKNQNLQLQLEEIKSKSDLFSNNFFYANDWN